MNHPNLTTSFPELDTLLTDLVSSTQEALGDNFVALYMQGSLAVGGFDEFSDVDYAVIIDHELSATELARLQTMHERLFNSPTEWARHLEGSYFPLEILRRHDAGAVELYYLDNGSSQLVTSTHCNTLVVRWVLYEYGIPLAGPASQELMAPVTTEELTDEVAATIQEWGADILEGGAAWNNRWYLSFIVLSYCRMLHTMATGRIHSKNDGAKWALQNVAPEWHDLIRYCVADRPDPWTKVRQESDPALASQVPPFLRYSIGSLG